MLDLSVLITLMKYCIETKMHNFENFKKKMVLHKTLVFLCFSRGLTAYLKKKNEVFISNLAK